MFCLTQTAGSLPISGETQHLSGKLLFYFPAPFLVGWVRCFFAFGYYFLPVSKLSPIGFKLHLLRLSKHSFLEMVWRFALVGLVCGRTYICVNMPVFTASVLIL